MRRPDPLLVVMVAIIAIYVAAVIAFAVWPREETQYSSPGTAVELAGPP
jgi:hypothetical protein